MQRHDEHGPSPALWSGLVDDAAVFPPGNASLPEAVRLHREHRRSRYAPLVGPLLIPASSCVDLLEMVHAGQPQLRVGLISRPGGDPQLLAMAAAGLAATSSVGVSIAELGWYPEWSDLNLDVEHLPIALEVPRGEAQHTALADIRTARDRGARVGAKFRTGATPTWAWPDEAELADFLIEVVQRRLPFKLTGGLHHAVRGRYTPLGGTEAEENHGLLNVILALAAALASAHDTAVAGTLADRDAERLAARVDALTPDQIMAVRDRFVAFGCCTVTDPIGELESLGLLDEPRPRGDDP